MNEIINMINQQGQAIESFKSAITKQLAEIEKKAGRIGDPMGGNSRNPGLAMKGLDLYVKRGDASQLLDEKAMATFSDPDGGYAVPEQIDMNIGQTLYEMSAMRQAATVVQSYTADYSVLRSAGGTAAGWVGEATARPETATSTLKKYSAPTGELYANPAATQQMLDDAGFDAAGWIVGEVTAKFGQMESVGFITGNGVNQPRGILSYPANTTADATRDIGTWKYVPVGSASSIANPDKLLDLVLDLPGYYRNGGAWLMNSKTAGAIRTIKDGEGQYIWSTAITAGMPNMLFGYRIYIDENMPDVAENAYPIAFGDFRRAYRIVDRTPVRILRDAYTNKPYVHFYCTKRVSGMMTDNCAVRLLKVSTT